MVVGAQYAAPLGKIGKYEVPMNHRSKCFQKFLWSFFFLWVVWPVPAQAQDKIKVAYSSTDTLNQIWTITQDAGFFKKNGLDVELVYIGSTTVAATAIVAQDIQVGNVAGSGVANAAVRGADTVSVGCTINVLAYELVVLDSIKTSEDLKGKSIGISRFGSVSDVAARELLKGLGLRPQEDVKILQVGGASERAAGFSRGVIAGFPSPPGNVNLIPGGLPHRVLADMDVTIFQTGGGANTVQALAAGKIHAGATGGANALQARRFGAWELASGADMKVLALAGTLATTRRRIARDRQEVSSFMRGSPLLL